MARFIYILLAISVLFSCNSNTILKKPENLISKEKMVDILVESYIAKNAKNIRNTNKQKNINYLSFIYANQGIDSVTFNESLEYYTSNISLNEEILKLTQESIDQKLNNLKTVRDTIFLTKIDSLEKAQKKILDEDIRLLKENQEEKLISKIDSIKNIPIDTFDNQILGLERSLKDTLKVNNQISINRLKDSINKQIIDVKKLKTDSINKIIEKEKTLNQELIDKNTKKIKEKNAKYLSKKTKEFERKKYK